MQEYSEADLKKVQSLEKMILKDFHKICKENNISYSIMYGSAIGVMRDHDIVPWDDDIDIALMREDMYKVIDIIKKEYSDKYEVLNFFENENFPIMTTHIVLKTTKFVIPEFLNVDCPFGVYLDIFPLDYISDDEKIAHKQFKKAWIYNKLFILRSMGTPHINVKGFKGSIVKVACRVCHFILSLFHVSKKYLYNKYLEQAGKYEGSKRVGVLASSIMGSACYEYKDIFPVTEKKLGEVDVMIANNIDELLRSAYGDYMKLPPKEEQKGHCPAIVDFGKYE